jgi:hypothetical protein
MARQAIFLEDYFKAREGMEVPDDFHTARVPRTGVGGPWEAHPVYEYFRSRHNRFPVTNTPAAAALPGRA